ncbi:MAG: thioredoxin domain-containing protein [Candidatus Gracilibacteria bacterium]|nr:thioredoxin domain-containing protein [Candidatus Gracilibacteria bacterium]
MKKIKFILGFVLLFLLFSCGKEIVEVKKDIDSPFFGDKNSDVQVKIYTDFQCPACISFEGNIGKYLLEEYALKNKIGITYKMFPLSFHQNAKTDALSALCSYKQGKYIEFAEKMYQLEGEKKGGDVSFKERLDVANSIGLNIKDFATCVNENNYLNKIKSDISDGENDKITGTPSIFINGTILDLSGIKGKEDFFKIIDNQISLGKQN